MIIYGIKNCDTMKKARAWLDQHGMQYRFHDYKKDGLTPELLTQFIQKLGLEQVLNKRGTSYRALSDEIKNNLTPATAFAAVLANPSLIKRPILVHKNQYYVGFSAEQYQQIISQ